MIHKHGGDIYSYDTIKDFSANINFHGMPESVKQAAHAAVEASVHYPDPDYRSLRAALAIREACAKEQIICGNGAAELMFALTAAKKPKKAVLAVPSFFEYEQALDAVGCEIRRIVLKKENGFDLTPSFFEELDAQTDLVILGNPNNPTGRMIRKEFLDQLLAVCREKSVFVVLDESFFDFLGEQEKNGTYSGMQCISENRNVFVLRSFTKMYAMPGLRFGYGISSDTMLLEQMRTRIQPWNVSVVAQAAAEAAAGETDFAKQTSQEIAYFRKRFIEQLAAAGYRTYPSDTNFILFEGPEGLADFCVRRGFLIRDCSNFPGLSKGYFRVCVRSREENDALMEALAEAAGKLGRS